MSTYKPVEGIKFEVGPDMVDTDSRITRGVQIGSQSAKSPLASDPEMKPALDAVAKDTAALKTDMEEYNVTQAAAKKARSALFAAIATWDGSYRLLIAAAEKHCTTADDGTGLGLVVRGKTSYPLAPPLSVSFTQDLKKGLVRIQVKRAPGMRSVSVEMSNDPSNPASWSELPGNGARHTLKAPTPGVWWVRAASRTAKGKSEFTTLVSLIVK
jgi:hypothetical protein